MFKENPFEQPREAGSEQPPKPRFKDPEVAEIFKEDMKMGPALFSKTGTKPGLDDYDAKRETWPGGKLAATEGYLGSYESDLEDRHGDPDIEALPRKKRV